MVLTALAGTHPLHTTFTEVVEVPGGATVTVRAFTDDLSRAVHGGAAPGDSAVAAYVRARLVLTDPSGRLLALTFTGQHQTADLTWLSFSVSPTSGLAGLRIANRLQTELYPDQVNLVQARYSSRSETLLFSASDGARTLP
jgi:hypothetical protein